MKVLKKILIYLAIIVAVLLTAILVCFAVMYFAPNTSILGYEYVYYKNSKEYEYNSATDPSVANLKAFEIVTNVSDIYVFPNEQSDTIKIVHNQGISGFTKSINAGLSIDINVIAEQSFEESLTNYKTMSIKISEPTGWIAKSNANIILYVPYSLDINTIYLKSEGGNIYYNSHQKDYESATGLTCTNLYMSTSNYNKLDINNKNAISNYYLTTDKGKVSFNNVTNLSANTIKFTTNSGSFNLTNSGGNATLNLTNDFIVKSYDKKLGPYVKINKLNANLKVNAENGEYIIDEIGSYGNYRTVAMTLNKSKINFGKVYAYVSILGEGNDISNTISINHLNYTANMNMFENGSGSVTINNLNGDASFDATSGSINIKSATVTSNVYAYTDSGNINVSYIFSEEDNKATKLTILTNTGNINLYNVSVALNIKVLANSANSNIYIRFTAVASLDNVIEAKNRKITLVLKGVSDNLQFRIVSTNVVKLSEDMVGKEVSTPKDEDGSTNNDYLLGTSKYSDFKHGYRIGYTKENNTYNTNEFDMWGKLLITTSGLTNISSDLT